MPRPPRHPTPAEFQRIKVPEIAQLLGLTEPDTQRLLRKHSYLTGGPRMDGSYDREVVSLLRDVLGQPQPESPANWLNDYLQPKEPKHG